VGAGSKAYRADSSAGVLAELVDAFVTVAEIHHDAKRRRATRPTARSILATTRDDVTVLPVHEETAHALISLAEWWQVKGDQPSGRSPFRFSRAAPASGSPS